jgi:outer membrane protein assembly factor BamB
MPLNATFALTAVLAAMMVNPATMVATHHGGSIIQSDTLFRYDWNRTGIAHESSDIVTPQVRWTFQTDGVFATAPLTYDVDGDGKKEVFFGQIKSNSDPRTLYALDSLGQPIWTDPVKWDVRANAVSDIDGDGTPEVIFSELSFGPKNGLSLYVADAVTGALKWTYMDVGTFWEEGFAASPVLFDVNNDGVKDLTLGSLDRHVYTFDGARGSILWRSPVFEHYILASSPFADLNGDGERDFVALDNHAVARAYSIKTHTMLWERRIGYGVEATPAIGDLNGDGKPEIVFSFIDSGGIQVLRNDGSLLWANEDHTYFYTSPTLVDVDGDGLPDVVNGDSFAHTIVAYRGTDGTELWQTVLPDTDWSQAALVTADIDGDGRLEILAGSDVGLYSLDAKTGQIEWFFPARWLRSEPRVADIDGDGKAEVLFGAGDGKLYVIGQSRPPRFEPRTIGYWKHQCNVGSPSGEHVGMPQSFIDAIRSRSAVFSNLTTPKQACDILWAEYKGDIMGMAKRQLLALWLNVVSGFVDPTVQIDLPKLTNATTVGGAILDTENTILTHTDKPSLERVKNLCDSINNGKIK